MKTMNLLKCLKI